MSTSFLASPWTYRQGEEVPKFVVLLDDSEDSVTLRTFLDDHQIPFTSVPSDGKDPEEWPNSDLPAIFIPSESRNGQSVVFRGLRQIRTRFLERFQFED